MVDLSVTFMSIPFRTPFLLASGQITTSAGEIWKHCGDLAKNDWSGLVTKTIVSRYGHYKRPHLWTSERFRSSGMTNSGPPLSTYSRRLIDDLKRDIEAAHSAGLVIIPSLIGSSLEEWKDLAGEIACLGPDALELNLSCPSPSDEIRGSLGGYLVGQSAEMTARVVESVCSACVIPVMPKLTFHAPDVVEIASACRESGARGVSAINTIRGVIGVDVESGRILSEGINGKTYLGGISGPIIKPFGLFAVAEIKRGLEGIEVCGVGGIDGWESAVEYVMVGASLVQVCTAAMWHGFSLGKRLTSGLSRFMNEKGFATLAAFRGVSLNDVDWRQRIPGEKALPMVDVQACTLCGKCVRACQDAAYGALCIEASRVTVDPETCECCGLCRVVCEKNAIRFAVDPKVT
jgi:dihydropyrimidine dehydrogenase (NAD+) subunit PreA